jgi:hypothetical protein
VSKRKRKQGAGSFLDAYRRIRKPVPPPERVEADRRSRVREEDARREIEEASRRDDPAER